MPSRRNLLALADASLGVPGLVGCSSPPAVSAPRIADQPCPPVELDADRAVCSHISADSGVVVEVTNETVTTAPKSLEESSIEIRNRTNTELEFDPSR